MSLELLFIEQKSSKFINVKMNGFAVYFTAETILVELHQIANNL